MVRLDVWVALSKHKIPNSVLWEQCAFAAADADKTDCDGRIGWDSNGGGDFLYQGAYMGQLAVRRSFKKHATVQ